MTGEADRELLARLRRGDESAFDAIFHAHHASLCAFAFGYLHSREDAEETVQSVLLALWQHRARIDVRSSLKAYLFTSVRNHALNRSARARLEQRWYDENAEAPPPGAGGTEQPSTDAAAESAEISLRVRAAIETLPPGARRVLVLRWMQQMSHAEIAETLQISIKGVENQLARAKQAMRARLSDFID